MPCDMATITALQKNGIKAATMPNGNGLMHQVQVPELANLAGYGDVVAHSPTSPIKQEMDEDVCDEEAAAGAPLVPALPVDAAAAPPAAEEPEIDIVINNVVCSFSVSCHLNLREIALNGTNVEYRKENGMITMKIRRPYTTASIWSSGKVTCTGATSEPQAKVAARRFARALQKLGFHVRFNNYRVVNVLGTCCMPFGIKINSFSERHKEAEYEPELHPGVTYKLKVPKATLKIFSTGSVTVTAPCVADVQAAIEYIFPLVFEYRKVRTPEEIAMLNSRKNNTEQDVVFELTDE